MIKNIHVISLLAIIVVLIFSVVPAFAQTAFDDKKKDFDVYVEETLAHIKAAEDNLDQNNNDLALSHLTQPMTGLYVLMKPELDESNPALSQKIQQTLSNLGDRISKSTSRQDAQNVLDDAKQSLANARDAVVGNVLYDNIQFKVDVINDLLENTIDYYGKGVSNGTIISPVDFQTASAFVWKSKQLYADIKPQIPNDKIKEIDEHYGELSSAYEQKIGILDVDPMTDKVKHAFSMIGQSETVDLSTLLKNVKSLLNQAKDAYSGSDKDGALNLVTKAYLENFEGLEPTIADNNPDLKKELEKMIREDLRSMIKNGAAVSDVSAEIDSIQTKLDSVASVVPEFGPLAGSVLILAISSIIAMRIKNNKLMSHM